MTPARANARLRALTTTLHTLSWHAMMAAEMPTTPQTLRAIRRQARALRARLDSINRTLDALLKK